MARKAFAVYDDVRGKQSRRRFLVYVSLFLPNEGRLFERTLEPNSVHRLVVDLSGSSGTANIYFIIVGRVANGQLAGIDSYNLPCRANPIECFVERLLQDDLPHTLCILSISTGTMFRLLTKLMVVESTRGEQAADFGQLCLSLGRYFQIRDDYQNLESKDVSWL